MTTLRGHAHGAPTTLEVVGDTLTWRSVPTDGARRDNLATTIHDIKDVAWVEQRVSPAAVLLGVLGAGWAVSADLLVGLAGLAVAAALLARRLLRPVRRLLLACGDRRLALDVEADSAPAARALAARIHAARVAGDGPASPPTLP